MHSVPFLEVAAPAPDGVKVHGVPFLGVVAAPTGVQCPLLSTCSCRPRWCKSARCPLLACVVAAPDGVQCRI